MSGQDGKAARAEQQRQWRSKSGKIGVTVYFRRHEVEVLDWLAWQLLLEDLVRPEAVGRSAALRSLGTAYAVEHHSEISEWRQCVASPEERAGFYRRELGHRRREESRGKFEGLPPSEQERIKKQAAARLHKEKMRQTEKAREMLVEHNTREPDDHAVSG
jgi:hypothetical protein